MNLKVIPYVVSLALAIVLGVVVYEARLAANKAQAAIASLKSERDEAARRANVNAAEAAKLQAQVLENERLAAEAAATRRSLAALTQEVQNAIAESPPSDDGPVAPVLGRTLDRLREAEAGR